MNRRLWIGGLGRLFSRISIRLLAFNLLLVFLPVAGLTYFRVFEEELLKEQEQSMVQQGRLLAAVLSDPGGSLATEAHSALTRLGGKTTTRIRIVGPDGNLLADSSRLGRQAAERTESKPYSDSPAASSPSEPDKAARAKWSYRLGRTIFRAYSRLVSDESDIDREAVEFYRSDAPLLGPEIRRALEGRYGAAWRVSPGQRSVTLYSALPIVEDGRVVGVVLVSQSTFRVLLGLYDVRSSLFRVVLASVLVAAVLSLLVSGTIVRPIRRLGEQAAAILDGRGKMGGRFRSTGRRDEIGDLARALEGLSTRLEQRIQFLDSVAADLSHEFKNPLACIRAAGDALLESETPDDRGRFGKVISDEVKRMEHLISSVREMALIDAQLDSERKSAVNMADILEHLAQRFSLLDSNKPRILMLVGKDTGRSECVVSASPERLAQVFENLLDNAVSLSPPDRPVEITLSRENGMVAATVRDHGPGIPEEHLELIFRRFFSYRPAEAGAKARHAGLGLAIAKAIVEGYGGTITAGNHPEGGALFIVKLTSREA